MGVTLTESLMQGALAAARQDLVPGTSNWAAFMAAYINEAAANDPAAAWRAEGFNEWRQARASRTTED